MPPAVRSASVVRPAARGRRSGRYRAMQALSYPASAAADSPVLGAHAPYGTTTRQNAHGTELEVCYRWHPWFGHRVTLVRKLQKRTSDSVHVELERAGRSRLLELPSWMLDRAACAAMELRSEPRVECAHLRSLRELLQYVTARDAIMVRDPGSPNSGDADEEATFVSA